MDVGLVWNFFLATVAIVNPLGKIPVWVQACEGCEAAVRMRLAFFVTGTATVVLAIFLLFGRSILEFLSLDVPAFRVGGGIVILLIGIDMLKGRAVEVNDEGASSEDSALDQAKSRFRDVAVPVAVPILAGPGSITTVMLYGSRAEDWYAGLMLAVVLAGVMLLVLGVLLLGHTIRDIVGDLVLNVQTRIWGLLLTAIAAQLIIVGLGQSFPDWMNSSSPIKDDVRQESKSQ